MEGSLAVCLVPACAPVVKPPSRPAHAWELRTGIRRIRVAGAALALALALLLSCFCEITGAAAPAQIPDYYADGYAADVFDWPDVTRNAASGLPMVSYLGLPRPLWNYVTVALYGLQRWSDWRHHHGGGAARADAIEAADFLIAHQGPDGAWRYEFPFSYSDADGDRSQTLPAGWVAAQAQGNAISLLARMYAATGESRYLTAANRGLGPLRRPVGDGGVAVTLAGHTLLAGYPTPTPTLTLEDYEGALIGVADLAPYSQQAQQLLSTLLPSFYWSLPLYTSASGMPYYDLFQDFVAGARGEIDPASAQTCAAALRTLLAGYPSPAGARALASWTAALGALGLGV